MGTPQELRSKLVELLGSEQVYYQPPEGQKMSYPAIVFYRSKIDKRTANNELYLKNKRYDLTVIANRPDNPVIDKILEMPYSYHDRQFKSDKCYHDVFTLYY